MCLFHLKAYGFAERTEQKCGNTGAQPFPVRTALTAKLIALTPRDVCHRLLSATSTPIRLQSNRPVL